MGVTRQMKDLLKEYKKDPVGQYYRNLDKMLGLHKTGKQTKQQVLEYVRKWAEK